MLKKKIQLPAQFASRQIVSNKATLFLVAMGIAIGSLKTNYVYAAPLNEAQAATIQFNIVENDLGQALQLYSQQSGIQVIAPSELIAGKKSRAVVGSFTSQQALSELLGNASLTINQSNPKTAVLSASNESSVRTLGAVNVEGSLSSASSTQNTGAHGDQSGGQPANAVNEYSPITGLNGSRDLTATEGNKSYAKGNVGVDGRRATDSQKIVQTVSVVGDQQLKDSLVTSVHEGLKKANGVSARLNSSNGEPIFYTRGEEIQNFSVDGVGTDNRSTVVTDLSLYDHIEVLRGTDAFLSSSNSAESGGSVNLVRKKPLDHKQILVDASVGRWNNYRGSVDATGPLNQDGTLRGRVIGAVTDKDQFWNDGYEKNKILDGHLEYDISDQTLLSVGANISEKKNNPWFDGIPRSIDGRDLGLSRDFSTIPDWVKQKLKTHEFNIGIEHTFNENWSAQINAVQRHADIDSTQFLKENENYIFQPNTDFFYTQQVASGKVNETAFNASMLGEFKLLNLAQKLEVSGQYRKSINKTSTDMFESETVKGTHIADFDFKNLPQPDQSSMQLNSKNEIERSSIYAKFDLQFLPDLHLLTGPRWMSAGSERNSTYIMPEGEPFSMAEKRPKKDYFSVPYYALRYDVNSLWSVYASYTDEFQIQDEYKTFTGKSLDPRTGSTKEIGVKFSNAAKDLTASFALYQTRIKNMPVLDLEHPAPPDAEYIGGESSCCYIMNGQKKNGQGAEFEIAGTVSSNWQTSFGYTYNKNELKSDGKANQLVVSTVPQHIVKWANTFNLQGNDLLSRTQLGFDLLYQSDAYNVIRKEDKSQVKIEQGDYILGNVFARYNINENLSTQLNINNVFDKKYYETLGTIYRSSYYGEPRNIILSLQAKF